MGNTGDDPQRGFNHWESFKGQGVYFNPVLNINGERVVYKDSTYITDLLTDHAIEWMRKQEDDKPFFMYVSHKGVHDEFRPAPRHRGLYHGQQISYPSTINLTAVSGSRLRGDLKKCPTAELAMYDTNYNVNDIPAWVWKQRNSWHGVDFLYDGKVDFDDFYYRYCETLIAIDESVAKIMAALETEGKANNTMIIYMGDNGFLMGEHGLIDKRNMYEESQKIPMLLYAPGMKLQNHTIDAIVQNIDIAPTILAVAGVEVPKQMQGQSFLPLLKGENIAWRNKALYEYYWEFSYPQTPSTLGVREGNYKFIFYPGIWDISEFFDLSKDPEEKNNLYRHPQYQHEIAKLRKELWDWLNETGGMQIPLKRIDEPRIDFGNKGLY
jgi:arylsulfatase A-like enzyme